MQRNTCLPEKFPPLATLAENWARGPLEQGQKVPAAIWVVSGEDVFEVLVDTASSHTREESARRARLVAEMENADFVLFIAEAWGLSAKDVQSCQLPRPKGRSLKEGIQPSLG